MDCKGDNSTPILTLTSILQLFFMPPKSNASKHKDSVLARKDNNKAACTNSSSDAPTSGGKSLHHYSQLLSISYFLFATQRMLEK